MTVIEDVVTGVAGRPHRGPVRVWAPRLRGATVHAGVITPDWSEYWPTAAGMVTTDDLAPGAARVAVGGQVYDVQVPDSASPVRLWPLIDAGAPQPADDGGFVRNRGGIRAAVMLTQEEFDALGGVYDPETYYAITQPA